MMNHQTNLTVFQALDYICEIAVGTGQWVLPYTEPLITDKGINMLVGTFDENPTFGGYGIVAGVNTPNLSKYRRAHLQSVDGSVQINLAASYRNSYAAQQDAEANAVVYEEGGLASGYEAQTNTPVPLWMHRYDADKDGTFPDRYDVNISFEDPNANKDGGWRGWFRRFGYNGVRGQEMSWIAVNGTKTPTFNPTNPWYLQDGDSPCYGGAVSRPIVCCACFQKDYTVDEVFSDEGPVIDDLWVFHDQLADLGKQAITAVMRQKVVYTTGTQEITKYFYQFLYFGYEMHDFRSPEAIPGFFNASNLAHSPLVGFYTDEPQFDFHNTTGTNEDLPLGAVSTFRDTSNTVFIAQDEGIAGAPYSSPQSGGWGCGGGNICTGPLSRNGINSTAHRTPVDDYVDAWTEQASALRDNACSPVYAGYERNRQYLRMLDVQCYRAFDEGIHPTVSSKWEGVVDRGGVALVGVLPGLALASTATVDRAKGYGYTEVGNNRYWIFPFFTIDDNFSNDIGDFLPGVPKADQNATPSKRWQDMSFHHRGVGLAVIDPVPARP